MSLCLREKWKASLFLQPTVQEQAGKCSSRDHDYADVVVNEVIDSNKVRIPTR